MTCAGIHTLEKQQIPGLYLCTECGHSGLSNTMPLPKLCVGCAQRHGLCRQCARKLDASGDE